MPFKRDDMKRRRMDKEKDGRRDKGLLEKLWTRRAIGEEGKGGLASSVRSRMGESTYTSFEILFISINNSCRRT
jgi:hypothetical protein